MTEIELQVLPATGIINLKMLSVIMKTTPSYLKKNLKKRGIPVYDINNKVECDLVKLEDLVKVREM